MQSEPRSGIKLTAYSCICWLFHRIYYDARNHKHKTHFQVFQHQNIFLMHQYVNNLHMEFSLILLLEIMMTVYSCHKELKVKIYATIFVPVVLCGYSMGSEGMWQHSWLSHCATSWKGHVFDSRWCHWNFSLT